MKFENLGVVKKWREYAGPIDERIELQELKQYRVIAILLMLGIILAWYFEQMYRQISWIHDLVDAEYYFRIEAIDVLGFWMLICLIGAIAHGSKKGTALGSSRRSQSETFPAGYFAILSSASAAFVFFIVFLMRTGIEVSLVGTEETFWVINIVVALITALLVGVATFLSFFSLHKSAQKKLAKMEEALED